MAESGSGTEKRKEMRHLVKALEVFQKASGERLGRLVDLSLGGMLITHKTTMELNAEFPIIIPLNHSKNGLDDFEADVQFRWFSQYNQTGLFGFGLEFLDNTDEQRRLLQGIIDEFSHVEH
ncbi:MAG: PilZ domain-containing protein [Chloroflexi bacterium]|nr:PilZ domain-containing protein [Chloroflexota bacterium]